MKKYFFGIIAIIIAIGSAAFTAPKKPVTDMYVFEYDPTHSGGYTVSAVEDPSNVNWKYVGLNQALCSGSDSRACRIAVTAPYVNSTFNPTELKDLTISASESAGGIAYVDDITDNNSPNIFSNKP